jgi:hypothetical protein
VHGRGVADVKIAAENVSIYYGETVGGESSSRYFCVAGSFKERGVLIHVVQDVREDGNEVRKNVNGKSIGVIFASAGVFFELLNKILRGFRYLRFNIFNVLGEHRNFGGGRKSL